MFRKQEIVEKRTVLFVDDDASILSSLERGLMMSHTINFSPRVTKKHLKSSGEKKCM